jgi:hypothetical protein
MTLLLCSFVFAVHVCRHRSADSDSWEVDDDDTSWFNISPESSPTCRRRQRFDFDLIGQVIPMYTQHIDVHAACNKYLL